MFVDINMTSKLERALKNESNPLTEYSSVITIRFYLINKNTQRAIDMLKA